MATTLTARESFRLGFLLRCAEEGCDAEEIQGRVKLAGWWDETKGVGSVLAALAAGVVKLPFQAAAYGIGASGLAGAAGGYGLAKMQAGSVDPEEAKRQELISAYRLQAELARRRSQQRTYRRGAPAVPRF